MNKLTMSNASHGHIIGRPIYQQYETVPYANPLLSRASDRTSLSILNTRPQSSGVRPVSVARLVSAARGQQQDKRRTRGGQQQDKRRQEERKTRPQSLATGARPRPVSVARAGQRGQDNSRTREGHQQEKRRTRPGHRARPQSSGARPVSVASSFVLRQRPNSKLLGEYIDLYIYIYVYIFFRLSDRLSQTPEILRGVHAKASLGSAALKGVEMEFRSSWCLSP